MDMRQPAVKTDKKLKMVSLSDFKDVLLEYLNSSTEGDAPFPFKRYRVTDATQAEVYAAIRELQYKCRGQQYFANNSPHLVEIVMAVDHQGLDPNKIQSRAIALIDHMEPIFTREPPIPAALDQEGEDIVMENDMNIQHWSRGQPIVKFVNECDKLCMQIKHAKLKGKETKPLLEKDEHVLGVVHRHIGWATQIITKTTGVVTQLQKAESIAYTRERALLVALRINTKYNLFFNQNRPHPLDDRFVEIKCNAPGTEDADVVAIIDKVMLPYVAIEKYQWQARKLQEAPYYDIIHDPGDLQPVVRLSQVICDCNPHEVPGFVNDNPRDNRLCNLITPLLTDQRFAVRTHCNNNKTAIQALIACDAQYYDPSEVESPFYVYLRTTEPILNSNYQDAHLTADEIAAKKDADAFPGLYLTKTAWIQKYFKHGKRTSISIPYGKGYTISQAKIAILMKMKNLIDEANDPSVCCLVNPHTLKIDNKTTPNLSPHPTQPLHYSDDE
jgi:hypothetical protein